MTKLVSFVTTLAAAAALTGCQATPSNRGVSTNRMDPGRLAPGERYGQTLTSVDLVQATDAMARDIAGNLDVTNRDSPPRITVGRFENLTTMPQQNYQVFLERVRTQLMQSGARYGLEFIKDRRWVEQQRVREYGDDAGDYASRADYVLTCEARDMPSAGTMYYRLEYQLVQLRDADTGPAVGPGVIVWSNQYEVKLQ